MSTSSQAIISRNSAFVRFTVDYSDPKTTDMAPPRGLF